MHLEIAVTTWRGRQAWSIGNDVVTLVVLQGGGHFASLTLRSAPRVNPLWRPVWRTIEPWAFVPAQAGTWGGSRLLASVAGHLFCLSYFGGPSTAEAARGRDGHGEAPVARWRVLRREVTARHAQLSIGCKLPVAGMRVERTLTVRPGSNLIEVTTAVSSTVDRDQPYTMAEHASVGAPFLEKDVTRLDASAVEGMTYPTAFSGKQRLKINAPFTWPDGPGARGERVDLRTLARAERSNSDFSTQHLDAARSDAWASAVNPRQGVMLGYHWQRRDFPWLGNWEENRCRREAPWNGRELVRGLEFANTPFPTTLEQAVALNRLHGDQTYGWLPARGTVTTAFHMVLLPVDRRVCGVTDMRRVDEGLAVDFIM